MQFYGFFHSMHDSPPLHPLPPPHLLADSFADLSDFITFQIPAVPSSIVSISGFPPSGKFHECKQVNFYARQ